MPQSEIWYIEQVRRRGECSTAVVAEKFIAVHIVNITKFGKLILVKSLNVVPSTLHYKTIFSLTATDNEGEILMGGHKWMKKLAVKVSN